jgi:hypothetical protein
MSSLPESLVRFRTELEDAIRRDLEAEATARSNGRAARMLHAVSRRPGRTTLAFMAVAGAAAAALFVSSPWKTSPGFLEQVQAAIAPQARTVLHFKLVITEDRAVGCKVMHPPTEYWVDLERPNKWRAFEVKQTDICEAGTLIEIGGEGASGKATLVFRPPNTLQTTPEWPNAPSIDPDPYGGIRQAIDDGTAHLEGRTVLDDGRRVERVRVDCDVERFPGCGPLYWYVDPETFLPVRTLAGPGLRPEPGATCTAPCFSQDFDTYEYLPATPANRALADIRAQHPDAKER